MIKNNEVSTLLKLFQGQFRHEIKCTTPKCNFVDTSTEPFLCVSLSVPLPRKYTVKFICMPPRKITRFHFDISESGITVKDVMEAIKKKIMEIKNYGDQSYGDMVACKIEPNGQSYLVPDNIVLESYSQLNDFTILEIPGEINKQLEQKLVIAIVNYVFDGKIFGEPYIAYFYKDLTYEQLSFELMRNGEFLLPQPSYKINLDFKLVLLNSANGSVYYSFQETDGNVYCPQTSEEFDSTTLQPLVNSYVDSIFNDEKITKKVIHLNVEWDLSLKNEFEYKYKKEKINENFSLENNFNKNSKRTQVSLITMLDNFCKSEPIQCWNCPKCKNLSGSMQIKLVNLPDILVFYLKRFNQSGRGTIKNTKIVNNPEELDMSPYCINGDIYDLSCVIYHHGFQFSSGHYTAATRNFIDKKWRLFDDNRVSEKSQNEICESDCTYMLFYQRRRSNDWFPDGVPNKIIEKYQRITEGDDREKNRQRNNYSQMNRKNSRHFGNY